MEKAEPPISLHSVYKKEGNTMTKEEIEGFEKERCNKCTKNIDCKIVRNAEGKLVCIEED